MTDKKATDENKKIKYIRTAKGLDKEIWTKIVECFTEADVPEKTAKLFLELLTDQERETIARRLAIISLVKVGKGYREISERLWVSPATISAVKKCLLVNNGYKSRREFDKEKDIEKLASKKTEPVQIESRLDRLLDYIAFNIEHMPRKSGPHFLTADYGWTAPIGYWHKNKRCRSA